MQYGTEEQKHEHLPGIIKGEIRWCQGYSEPGSGSDLASLKTRAILEGDHYVINGQKVWTSFANLADWMFVLVRTDPEAKKQEGITFLLVDMQSPGVETRPIKLISGASPFCETFLTDVHAPAKNVIFEVNKGWTVAKALLNHERNMIASAFGTTAGKGRTMRDWAKEHLGLDGDRVADSGNPGSHGAVRNGQPRLSTHHRTCPRCGQSRSAPRAGKLDVQDLRHRAEPASS